MHSKLALLNISALLLVARAEETVHLYFETATQLQGEADTLVADLDVALAKDVETAEKHQTDAESDLATAKSTTTPIVEGGDYAAARVQTAKEVESLKTDAAADVAKITELVTTVEEKVQSAGTAMVNIDIAYGADMVLIPRVRDAAAAGVLPELEQCKVTALHKTQLGGYVPTVKEGSLECLVIQAVTMSGAVMSSSGGMLFGSLSACPTCPADAFAIHDPDTGSKKACQNLPSIKADPKIDDTSFATAEKNIQSLFGEGKICEGAVAGQTAANIEIFMTEKSMKMAAIIGACHPGVGYALLGQKTKAKPEDDAKPTKDKWVAESNFDMVWQSQAPGEVFSMVASNYGPPLAASRIGLTGDIPADVLLCDSLDVEFCDEFKKVVYWLPDATGPDYEKYTICDPVYIESTKIKRAEEIRENAAVETLKQTLVDTASSIEKLAEYNTQVTAIETAVKSIPADIQKEVERIEKAGAATQSILAVFSLVASTLLFIW